MNRAEIIEKLKFDPITESEILTGYSDKTNDLAVLLAMEKTASINRMMDELGDTKFVNTLSDYLLKAISFGFEVVLREPFVNSDGVDENFFIMWLEKYSILLCFDTHTWGDDGSWTKPVPPPNVNGGHFYYNIKLKPHGEINYRCIENGHFVDKNFETKDRTWIGHHDCRTGLKSNIEFLADNGEFLKQWVKQPFLWLLHHGDTDKEGYDYKKINEERIAKLPKKVRDAITPEKY